MERFSFVFLVAGLGFFCLAFVVSAWLPWMPFTDLEIETVEQLAAHPPLEFLELEEQYPGAYEKAFGGKTSPEAFAEALVVGRKIYVGEGCWHCHSQQVRPVGNDEARFGRASYPEEYNNDMNYPPIWGTRRVGPDLIREAGRQSNDWHVAHFWNPPDVSPTSVMPRYTWFFEDDGKTPNKRGLSIIAYVQWLGSWHNNQEENIHQIRAIEKAYKKPEDQFKSAPADKGGDQKAKPRSDDDYGDDDFGDTDKTKKKAADDYGDDAYE